jgi:hypothetical protein
VALFIIKERMTDINDINPDPINPHIIKSKEIFVFSKYIPEVPRSSPGNIK